MSYAANPNKPRREKEESDRAIAAKQERADRERIRRLVITLGDDNKKIVSQIKGLVGALEDDVELHGDLIAETVLECAKSLPLKTNIFSAWIARMLEKHAEWASSVIARFFEELLGALREGRATAAQLLLRFLVCLGNTGTLALTQVMALLQEVLALSEGLRPAKGGDFGVFLALASLPYISPAAHSKIAEKADAIIARADAYLASREVRLKPLLRLFKNEDLPDRVEALGTAVHSLQQASWTAQSVLHLPGFEPSPEGRQEAPALGSLGLAAEDVRKSKVRLQVPLVTSRLLTHSLVSDGADDQMSEHDRWVLEDHVLLTVEMFGREVEECARQILRIPVEHPHFDAIIIETVFSMMLRLPSPPLLPLFYSRLLETLAVQQKSMEKVIEQAYTAVFQRLAELDEECRDVLAEAFAYHLMHNAYSADWSPFTGEGVSEQARRFLRRSLERLQRLSFHQNLLHRLPEAVHAYVPPEPLAATTLPVQAKPEFARMLGLVRIREPDARRVLRFCRRLLRTSAQEADSEEPRVPAAASAPPCAAAKEDPTAGAESGRGRPPEAGEAVDDRQEEARARSTKRGPEEAGVVAEEEEPEAKRQRTGEEVKSEVKQEEGRPAAEGAAPKEEEELGELPAVAWELDAVVELFAVAVMQRGANTPTHMTKMLDGHEQVFAELRPTEEGEAHSYASTIVRCVFEFWQLSGQRLEITLDTLLHRGVVTARAVVEQTLLRRGPLGCDTMAIWNTINSVARKSLEQSQAVRMELAIAKKLGKTEVVERSRRQLDAAVQETAELFTLIFTGLVRNYQDSGENDTILCKVTLERVLTIGRKYHAFIKPLIEAAESRIPGVAHNPDIAAVFHSLRVL